MVRALAMACLVALSCAATALADDGDDAPRCQAPPQAAWRALALQAANAWRARGARCGAREAAPAAALRWNERLERIALQQARSIADSGAMTHASDFGTLQQRADRAGYDFSLVAENLNRGSADVQAVFESWVGSAQHCSNLMHPAIREMALACAVDAEQRVVWSLLLGARR